MPTKNESPGIFNSTGVWQQAPTNQITIRPIFINIGAGLLIARRAANFLRKAGQHDRFPRLYTITYNSGFHEGILIETSPPFVARI